MKSYNTRIPLAIALSSALAFAVGCDNRTADDGTAMDPVDDTATQPAPPATTEPMTPADDAAYTSDATADATQAGTMDDGRDSDQPVDDTWITTKVKSSLLADTDVSGLKIDVETVNGVVTLTGNVEQQAQIDKAASIARGIEGVTDVQTTALVVTPAN